MVTSDWQAQILHTSVRLCCHSQVHRTDSLRPPLDVSRLVVNRDGTDFRVVTSGEYIQMSGRAGRRGLDERGVVICMLDEALDPATAKAMLKGESDVLQQLIPPRLQHAPQPATSRRRQPGEAHESILPSIPVHTQDACADAGHRGQGACRGSEKLKAADGGEAHEAGRR